MRQLLSLQVLRAVGAIGVTIAHARQESEWMAGYVNVPNTVPNLVGGSFGVDLFFVISGFIMVYVSEPLFGTGTGARMFFTRRLIRIVPLYWFATGLLLSIWYFSVGTWLAREGITWGDALASFLFMSTREGRNTHSPLLGAGWSLNYEMFFYVVFAFSMVLPRRQAVMFACSVMLAMALFGPLLAVPDVLEYLTHDFKARPMFLEFIIGMVIGLAYAEGWRVSRPTGWVLALAGGSILAAIAIVMACGGEPKMVAAANMIGVASPRIFVWGMPSAMLLVGCLCVAEPESTGPVWRFLVLLGNASYAIYVLHGPIHVAVRSTFLGFGAWVAHVPWAYTTFLVVAAIAVAVAFHIVVERPFTDWLRSFALRPRYRPALPSVS